MICYIFQRHWMLQFRANVCTVNAAYSNILTLRMSEGDAHRRDRNSHTTVTRGALVVSETDGRTRFKQPVSHFWVGC